MSTQLLLVLIQIVIFLFFLFPHLFSCESNPHTTTNQLLIFSSPRRIPKSIQRSSYDHNNAQQFTGDGLAFTYAVQPNTDDECNDIKCNLNLNSHDGVGGIILRNNHHQNVVVDKGNNNIKSNNQTTMTTATTTTMPSRPTINERSNNTRIYNNNNDHNDNKRTKDKTISFTTTIANTTSTTTTNNQFFSPTNEVPTRISTRN